MAKAQRSGARAFWTIQDVAVHLGVSEKTVRRHIKVGRLAAHRVGAQLRVSDRDLRAYLATCRAS